MTEILAHHSGPIGPVARDDLGRDDDLTPEEARDYGLIDEIILPRLGVGAVNAVPELAVG